VLAADHPALHVVGVKTEGGSNYAKVIVIVANCHAEPCRLSDWGPTRLRNDVPGGFPADNRPTHRSVAELTGN
jgi:hypothetical protein